MCWNLDTSHCAITFVLVSINNPCGVPSCFAVSCMPMCEGKIDNTRRVYRQDDFISGRYVAD